MLRYNDTSRVDNTGKLGPRCEGPYMIDTVEGKGAYKLRTLGGVLTPQKWNGVHLKKCYMQKYFNIVFSC